MRMNSRLCLFSLFTGVLVLAGCSSSTDMAKAKADVEANKAELGQVKSEMAQMKSDLAKVQGPQDAGRGQGVRYQLIQDPKGGAYLFDSETGKVLHSDLKGRGWMIAADPAR